MRKTEIERGKSERTRNRETGIDRGTLSKTQREKERERERERERVCV